MLNPGFKEFIQSLNDNLVRYLVVGGYAVALHGYPRYTKDIDIWIEMEPANSARIMQALQQFGFGSLGFKRQISWRLIPLSNWVIRRAGLIF